MSLLCQRKKKTLSRFLSEQMIANALPDKTIVIARGFPDEKEVQSSQPTTYISALAATHEEADTRIVLHGINNDCSNVVVSARDTDVLLMMVSHFPRFRCQNLWMSGTAKNGNTSPSRIYLTSCPLKLQCPFYLSMH
jgi:hypothetical protein